MRRTRFHANRGSLACGGWCECLNARPQAAIAAFERHHHHHRHRESLSPPYRDVRSQRAACELSTQINVLDKYLRRISAPRRKFSVKNENRARGLSRDFAPLSTKALASVAISPSGSNKWPRGNNKGGGFSFNFPATPSREADSRSLITFSLRRPAPSGRIALHFIQSLHRISSSYADKLYASSPALTPDQRRADFRARQPQKQNIRERDSLSATQLTLRDFFTKTFPSTLMRPIKRYSSHFTEIYRRSGSHHLPHVSGSAAALSPTVSKVFPIVLDSETIPTSGLTALCYHTLAVPKDSAR